MNGWIIINKPITITSAKAVALVKKKFMADKAGHSGTLDPFATGVLPIALGEATKTTSFLLNSNKKYIFSLKFGSQTSTDDVEGEIIATSNNFPTESDILSAIPKFLGNIKQIPPIYSAIKLQGVAAYDRARRGEQFEMHEREVFIKSLRLLSFDGQIARLEVACGSGTYVRALGRDIALSINSVGHLVQLERTQVANFSIENSIDLNFLQNIDLQDIQKQVFPLHIVLKDLPKIEVCEATAKKIIYGQKIRSEIEYAEMITLWNNENIIALATVQDYICKPIRVFNIKDKTSI